MRLTFGSIDKVIRRPRPHSLPARRAKSDLIAQSYPITRRGFVIGVAVSAMAMRLPAQQRPRRIISTAPSITETLFALGLGSQVVGVSRFCDFPPEVRKLPKVGSYINPDSEAIARLLPDLVILETNSSELPERLSVLHIPFIEVPHGTLSDVFTEIQMIANAAGVPERAMGLIDRIKNSLAATQAKAKSLPSPRVLVILNHRLGALTDMVAVGPNNYVNQVIDIAGGINLLAKPDVPHYPHISMETMLRENPEVILDLSGSQESEAERRAERAATLSLWQQYPQLTAVRNRHVYAGTSNALLVPGPRTVEAAQRFFDYMHGVGNQS